MNLNEKLLAIHDLKIGEKFNVKVIDKIKAKSIFEHNPHYFDYGFDSGKKVLRLYDEIGTCSIENAFSVLTGHDFAIEKIVVGSEAIAKDDSEDVGLIKPQNSYEVGDKILIKDHWESGKQNSDGEMDKYLGSIMTIKYVEDDYKYRMEEDDNEWLWDAKDIEGKLIEGQIDAEELAAIELEDAKLEYGTPIVNKILKPDSFVAHPEDNDFECAALPSQITNKRGNNEMKLNINNICYNHDRNLCVNPCHGCDDFKSKSTKVKVTKRIIVKQKKYNPGDKVLIRKSWKKAKETPDAEMDKFLNTIVTIGAAYDNEILGQPDTYRMEEDEGHWAWYDCYIKGRVIE